MSLANDSFQLTALLRREDVESCSRNSTPELHPAPSTDMENPDLFGCNFEGVIEPVLASPKSAVLILSFSRAPAMEQLSLELLYQIAAALPSTSLAALQCTSKRSHAAFASNYFWRNLAKQIVPKEFANESDGDSLESPGLQPYPSEARHYKALISRYERVERNWKAGIFSGAFACPNSAFSRMFPVTPRLWRLL